MYGQMYKQLLSYCYNVARNIGGIMKTRKTAEQSGPVYEFVPRSTQKEAMAFLQRHLFSSSPTWLIDTTLQSLISFGGNASKVNFAQTLSIDALFNSRVFENLLDFEMERPGEAYTATEMLNDMKKGVWSELSSHKPIDIFRRNLQTSYVLWLGSFVKFSGRVTGASQYNDATAIIREHLRSLVAEIRTTLPGVKDQPSRMHLRNMLVNLEEFLNPVKLMYTRPY
jgi:hypothetical protein